MGALVWTQKMSFFIHCSMPFGGPICNWHSASASHPKCSAPSQRRGASHHYVHTGPDSHTRTHSPDGLTAGGPVPSLLTAPGQEGSRLSGPFQTPSHETETPFPTGKKKKASLNSPADPPPAKRGPGLGSFSRADRGIGGVRPVAPPTWLVSNFLVRPASS